MCGCYRLNGKCINEFRKKNPDISHTIQKIIGKIAGVFGSSFRAGSVFEGASCLFSSHFIFSNFRNGRRSYENVVYEETDTRERERGREGERGRGGGRGMGRGRDRAEKKDEDIYIYNYIYTGVLCLSLVTPCCTELYVLYQYSS